LPYLFCFAIYLAGHSIQTQAHTYTHKLSYTQTHKILNSSQIHHTHIHTHWQFNVRKYLQKSF